MPYLVLSDFSAGLDLRKSEVTAPPGTLRLMKNAHVTPGGEVEKRKAFVDTVQCPSDVFGLIAVGGVNYVFREGAAATDVQADYTMISIASTTADALTKILDWDIFDGDMYIVFEDAGGAVQHFYPATAGAFDFAIVTDSTGENKASSRAIRTYRNKIHGVAGRNLLFSAVNDPKDYAGTGSGFINLATQDAESEDLLALEVYYDTLAVMSKRAIQIWEIDPDPLLYEQTQVLRAAGTDAPQSLKQFGTGDVLYLAQSGIRSLRARDSSTAAAVSDIGSPIDEYIREMRKTKSADYMASGKAIIEPIADRFWMVFPNEILVLSLFPNPKVTAWSVYIPEFTIEAVSVNDDRVVLLSDDKKIYTYGAEVYDAAEAEILTPFLTANEPATNKQFKSLDIVCEGEWAVFARFNPRNPSAEDELGVADGPTFGDEDWGMDGQSTHCALRLATTNVGAATLSHVVLHYDLLEVG